MFELPKTPEVLGLTEITRSASGVRGPALARAHMELGRLLALHMDFPPEDTTVVAVLRSGLFLAQGLYFQLGCRFQLCDPKSGSFRRPETRYVILADAVINTGATIRGLLTPDTAVACAVIQRKAAAAFGEELYAARISDNAYVGADVARQCGAVGPDTTLRLFNLIS